MSTINIGLYQLAIDTILFAVSMDFSEQFYVYHKV